MPNNESVGKKIVEALKKQAENMETPEEVSFETETPSFNNDIFAENSAPANDFFSEPAKPVNFFDEPETQETPSPFFAEEPEPQPVSTDMSGDNFEMPANIAVLKKLISQLPSGVSRHTGAQIIKQTMEALGISMKSVLQDAQQVQESLKVSARECQASIQEYKKQILALEKQSQTYQKQYSALNDLISLFIQTTK